MSLPHSNRTTRTDSPTGKMLLAMLAKAPTPMAPETLLMSLVRLVSNHHMMLDQEPRLELSPALLHLRTAPTRTSPMRTSRRLRTSLPSKRSVLGTISQTRCLRSVASRPSGVLRNSSSRSKVTRTVSDELYQQNPCANPS